MKVFLTATLFFLVFMTSNAFATFIGISTLNDNVQFMLIDASGKRTGYEPITGTVVSESGLPFMIYYISNIETSQALPVHEPTQYMLQGEFPTENIPLNMKLVVVGMKLAVAKSITVDLEEYTGSPTIRNYKAATITTLLDAGQIANYEMAYTPSRALVVTKIATSNDLISDIKSASKLGLIGNATFVNELIKEVQKIEKERLHPAENEEHDPATPAQRAIKKYQKLLKEITEKYQKPEPDEFMKQEAYTVLKEDLDYIIAHIQ